MTPDELTILQGLTKQVVNAVERLREETTFWLMRPTDTNRSIAGYGSVPVATPAEYDLDIIGDLFVQSAVARPNLYSSAADAGVDFLLNGVLIKSVRGWATGLPNICLIVPGPGRVTIRFINVGGATGGMAMSWSMAAWERRK